MEFRVLGPLEVRDNGRTLELGGAKQRAVLAVLLLHAGEVVSLDRLIDTIWGERAPETAAAAVHGSISRLRKVLEHGGPPYRLLRTQAPGYVFAGGAETVDRDRFQRLAAEGKDAREAGDAARAKELLSAALGLWRGAVLTDLAHAVADRTELDRLEEERLAVLEERIDADLALGRHAELVPELEALVAREPLRERLRGQLMIALYGAGRQADALAAYREGRRILDETLGIAPSNELRELERRILQQEPGLTVPRPAPLRRVRLRDKRAALVIFLGIAVGLLVAAGAVALGRGREEPSLARVVPNGLGAIDPDSNRLVQSIPVGSYPADVAVGNDAVWVANAGDHTVARIDPQAGRVRTTKGLRGAPVRLNVSRGTVWIGMSHVGQPTSLVALEPRPNESAEHVAELTPQRGLSFPVLADGPSGLWASLADFRLSDEGTVLTAPDDTFVVPPAGNGLRLDVLPPGCNPVGSAIADAAVWIACQDGRLIRIDETTRRRVRTTRVGSYLSALAVGEGAVWAADLAEDVVWRIDTTTGRAARRIRVGKDPSAVAAGFGAVWVANRASGTVSRIDPDENRVVATISVGRGVVAIATGRDTVWVTVVPDGAVPD